MDKIETFTPNGQFLNRVGRAKETICKYEDFGDRVLAMRDGWTYSFSINEDGNVLTIHQVQYPDEVIDDILTDLESLGYDIQTIYR